jgi:orotate phosphoribosyltransferase
MERKRKKLLRLLHQKSYQFRTDPQFTLASGKKSPYYIDSKPTMHDPEGKTLIGEIVFDIVKEIEVDAIGGLTMGADPIAIATSLISFQKGKPIKSFSVRKTAKEHGTGKRIEGEIRTQERVVIVDDVITTGNSVIDAIKAAREFGLEILKVIVLVDRQEQGGAEEIRKWADLDAIFTLSQLKEFDIEACEGNSPKRTLSRGNRPAYSALRR